jgi:hypothetical protein
MKQNTSNAVVGVGLTEFESGGRMRLDTERFLSRATRTPINARLAYERLVRRLYSGSPDLLNPRPNKRPKRLSRLLAA